MTAGSGTRLCACLRKQSRIASFSRTLLESSTWGSTEYFLRWEGSATKHNRSIFRLVPLAPRNSGTGSGSLASWLTPSANDDAAGAWKQDLKMQEMLPHQLKGAMQAKATWATPCANPAQGTPEQFLERKRKAVKKGSRIGISITDLSMQVKATWPTPNVPSGGRTLSEADVIAKGNTAKGKRQVDTKAVLKLASGTNTSGCLAQTEKFVVRLMTLSSWLMGYTAAYLAPWGTASSRRSRTKSLGPSTNK